MLAVGSFGWFERVSDGPRMVFGDFRLVRDDLGWFQTVSGVLLFK